MSYFADPDAFWTLQQDAIAKRSADYQERGWAEVVILEAAHFPAYDYRKTTKKNGGKVYVIVAGSGEVTFHEGYLSAKDVRQAEKKAVKGAAGDQATKQPKPELTKAAQNYVDLHRHAAVQAALLNHSGIAIRLVTAHMIAGSSLWQIKPEKARADRPDTAASVNASPSKMAIDAERKAILALLGYDDLENDHGPLVDHSWSGKGLSDVLIKLFALEADQVARIMTYAMAETLAVSGYVIDDLGASMNVSLAGEWQADSAFLDSIVSKATLTAMLADIGGSMAADAHKDSTAKTIRSVIAQFAAGEGRPKTDGWVPPYLMFPKGQYVEQAEQEADEHIEHADDDDASAMEQDAA